MMAMADEGKPSLGYLFFTAGIGACGILLGIAYARRFPDTSVLAPRGVGDNKVPPSCSAKTVEVQVSKPAEDYPNSGLPLWPCNRTHKQSNWDFSDSEGSAEDVVPEPESQHLSSTISEDVSRFCQAFGRQRKQKASRLRRLVTKIQGGGLTEPSAGNPGDNAPSGNSDEEADEKAPTVTMTCPDGAVPGISLTVSNPPAPRSPLLPQADTHGGKSLGWSSDDEMEPVDRFRRPSLEAAEKLVRNDSQHVDIRAVFEKVACLDGDPTTISFEDWRMMAVEEVGLNLEVPELQRIFEYFDKDDTGKLNLEEFMEGYNNNIMLQQMCASAMNPAVDAPKDYDYMKSTSDYHKAADMTMVGEFPSIRTMRDYDYHVNYTPERQLWQDRIIKNVVIRTEPQPRPWIVFTAGPMGAGKGHVMSWMSAENLFPLENIVHIDPDHFKQVMPEWKYYLLHNRKNAGTMCHNESGFIQEIATEVALQISQNIWVDGSLRNGQWFVEVFKDIRKRFPHYRIAIFLIFASEHIVRQRCAHRALQTGRSIPEHLLVESLQAPERSVSLLTPYADMVCRICNDGGTPVLSSLLHISTNGDWCPVAREFTRVTRNSYNFPASLPPVFCQETRFGPTHFRVTHVDGFEWSLEVLPAARDLIFASAPALCDTVALSQHMVCYHASAQTSDQQQTSTCKARKQSFGAQQDLRSLQKLYVYRNTDLKVHDLQATKADTSDPHLSFMMYGGYLYVDPDMNVVVAHAFSRTKSQMVIQFGIPESVPADLLRDIKPQSVNLEYLRSGGARQMAWVPPGAVTQICPQGIKQVSRRGGFAYRIKNKDEDKTEDKDKGSKAPCTILYFPIVSNH